jgi:spore coat polysaccharide biosynthesis protein SpsF
MSQFHTPQEEFWAGEFGSSYIERNIDTALLASNVAFFSRILGRTRGVGSVMELGANVGLNLHAIRTLLPAVELAAVEVNPTAHKALATIPGIQAYLGSLLGFETDRRFDLTLCKGVLIHINPDHLHEAYEALYRHSRKYICVAEYYNPTPMTIPYRGHADRLFKRDFAGEMLGRYPDLHLVDYGFVYRKDPMHPQDDITWFLMERS